MELIDLRASRRTREVVELAPLKSVTLRNRRRMLVVQTARRLAQYLSLLFNTSTASPDILSLGCKRRDEL